MFLSDKNYLSDKSRTNTLPPFQGGKGKNCAEVAIFNLYYYNFNLPL